MWSYSIQQFTVSELLVLHGILCLIPLTCLAGFRLGAAMAADIWAEVHLDWICIWFSKKKSLISPFHFNVCSCAKWDRHFIDPLYQECVVGESSPVFIFSCCKFIQPNSIKVNWIIETTQPWVTHLNPHNNKQGHWNHLWGFITVQFELCYNSCKLSRFKGPKST